MDPISDSTIRYIWASFDPDGEIAASKDIDSVTKNGTGDFTVNFSGVMQTDNYFATITPVDSTGSPFTIKILSQDDSSCRFICRGGGVSVLGITVVNSVPIDPDIGINFFACC